MSTSSHSVRAAVLACVLGLTAAGCDATSDELILARAADHRLTVDEAVGIMAAAVRVPAEPSVVETMADLWIDYTLLAEAMREDSTLSHLDMTPLVRQQTDIEAIMALRDSLVSPDTTVTEEQLQTFYEETGSGLQARPSHILVAFPPGGATAAEDEEVRRATAALRERIEAGERFSDLAREYSQDSGSAPRGGDLGWVPEGQLVTPIDSAVFSMEVGEVSQPVRTDFGWHLIRLDSTRVTGLDDAREEVRAQLLQRRTVTAESLFIADLMADADVEVQEEGVELVRQMARAPRTDLSGRAARREVARHSQGEITVGEVRDFMLTRQPGYRAQVVEAPDSVVRDVVIDDLVRREVLLAQAEAQGLEIPATVVDSLSRVARERFVETARDLRIADVEVQPGESPDAALQRVIQNRLQAMLQGRLEVVPVGAVGFVLRREYPAEVYGQVPVARVIEGVERARGQAGVPPAGGNAPSQSPLPGAGGAPGPGDAPSGG